MSEGQGGSQEQLNALHAFVAGTEAQIEKLGKNKVEREQYKAYLEMLGGKSFSKMPLPSDTRAIGVAYSPVSKSSVIYPVDANRPIREDEIRQYSLADILVQKPQFPQFWESVAEDGIVHEKIYTQDPPFEKDNNVVNSIEETGAFPNVLIRLPNETTTQMSFLPPSSTHFLWPRMAMDDVVVFPEIPKEVDRAFRVYNNACETKGQPLFFDVDPSHLFYKNGSPGKRLAVEYKRDTPNRMRPVSS